MAFRPLPEHELRVADLGGVAIARWELTGSEDKSGQQIPLPLFGNETLPVTSIFE